MTISEYREALDALDEAGFATYRTDFGGDFSTRQQYVDDFVHHPEHERRICQLLGLQTEEEKLTEASLVSARAFEDSTADSRPEGDAGDADRPEPLRPHSHPWHRHPIFAGVAATLVAATILGVVSWWSRGVSEIDQPPASVDAGSTDPAALREVPVLLRQASGGGETGRFYSTPEAWYWLISPLTVINQGDGDDTFSFELQVPAGRGVHRVLQPIGSPPEGIDLPAGTRLFGIEDIAVRSSSTGGLLFRIDRLNFDAARALNRDTGDTVVLDQPQTRGTTILVRSELFPEQVPRMFETGALWRTAG